MLEPQQNKMAGDRGSMAKIKINAPLRQYAAGTVLSIRVDANGVPLLRYWRDRLEDAKTDNCVEMIPQEKAATKSTSDSTGSTDEPGK